MTRSLPGFKAAASAPSESKDKPCTSISLSKVSIDRCAMAYGTGQSEGYRVLMGTTADTIRGDTSIGFSLLGIEDVRRVRRVLSLVEGERKSVGWRRSGFRSLGLLRNLPFWDFEEWLQDLDVCMTLRLRRRWIFIQSTCLGHLSLPPLRGHGRMGNYRSTCLGMGKQAGWWM